MKGLRRPWMVLGLLAACAGGAVAAERAGTPQKLPRMQQVPRQLPAAERSERLLQAAPVLEDVKLQSPTGLWSKTYGRNVEVFLSWAPEPAPDSMRVSEHRDFRDADWEPARERFPFTLSAGSGPKRIFVQLRRAQTGPGGRTTTQDSKVRSGGTVYEDPLETAQAEVERLGCLWDVEARGGGIVAVVRCPLADLVGNVEGLDGIGVSLVQVPDHRIRLEVSGTVEGQEIDEAETLQPVEIADAVRVATRSLESRSTTVSAEGDVVKLRLDFESAGTEIVTALRQSPGWCDPCVPDLEWDDAGMTLNLRLGGTADGVAIEEIFVSDLDGDWDVAGNLGQAAVAALRMVGIGGAEALRERVSDGVSARVTDELNAVLESRRAQLEEALLAPLHEALADAPGDPTVGYQSFNHSFLVELPL